MTDGHRLLAALRDDDPATTSTVDVALAIRTGRRRRKLRVAAGTAVVAAVTVVVAVLAPALAHRSMPPAQPKGEFDLMRQELSVGSAGGYTPVSVETGRYRQRVTLTDGTRRATVTAYAPGRAPGQGSDRAPDVKGHNAFWGRNSVVWEWRPGAWAVAEASNGRSVAHRVAQSVAAQRTQLVLPFAEPALPAPYRLTGVLVPYRDTAAGALLVLDRDGTRVLLGVRRDVDRDFVTGAPRTAPVPDTQAGGRPAAVTSTSVTIFDSGPAVVAEAGRPAPDLVALASSVRPG